MSRRGVKAGRAFVELYADNSKLVRGLLEARSRVRAFGRRLQVLGAKMVTATAPMIAGIAFATRTFAGFSDQMAQTRAVTGATAGEFAGLTEMAKELGRTTSFTAAQVAGAMTELGRAGFKPAEILDSIGPVLDLARATATDLPRAAEIASAAMRGFGLAAKDTAYIADVLTATANNSAQGLEDIGESMKYVAPLAAEAGENIRDTAAALGVLANNGIKGSMAGTALARAYKNLATTGARDTLSDLGVRAVDAGGNLRKVADIISDLGQATAKMGTAQRLSIFETLFGRGSASALKLARGSNFKNMQAVLADVGGTSARTSKIMDDTLGGSFRKLWSAVEGVQIAIGESLAPTISAISDWMTRAAGSVTEWASQNKDLLATIARVTGVIFAAGASLIALGVAMKAVAFAMGALAGAVTVAKLAFVAFKIAAWLLLTPLAAVIVAVGALGGYLVATSKAGGQALDWLGKKFTDLKNWAAAMWTGISDALAAGDISLAANIAWLGLKAAWINGIAALEMLWTEFAHGFQAVFWVAAKGVAEAMLWVAKSAQNFWTQFKASTKAIGAWAEKEAVNLAIKATMSGDREAAAIAENEARYRRRVIDTKEGMDAEIAKSDAFYNNKVKDVQKNFEDRMVEISRGLLAATGEVTDEQKAAQAALDAAIAEARRKRSDYESGGDKGPEAAGAPGGLGSKIAKLLDELKTSPGGMFGAAGGMASGTFSSLNLGALGAGGTSPQERTAKAAEKTAENTKNINRKMGMRPRFAR